MLDVLAQAFVSERLQLDELLSQLEAQSANWWYWDIYEHMLRVRELSGLMLDRLVRVPGIPPWSYETLIDHPNVQTETLRYLCYQRKFPHSGRKVKVTVAVIQAATCPDELRVELIAHKSKYVRDEVAGYYFFADQRFGSVETTRWQQLPPHLLTKLLHKVAHEKRWPTKSRLTWFDYASSLQVARPLTSPTWYNLRRVGTAKTEGHVGSRRRH